MLHIPAQGAPQYLEIHSAPLVITSKTGEVKTKLWIEIARTPEQQAAGLSFRPKLPKDQGMLFLFAPPRILTFWMHNTPEPLDIVFFNDKLSIVKIHHNTTPFSKSLLVSEYNSIGALEVSAGTTNKLNIINGDKILHPTLNK